MITIRELFTKERDPSRPLNEVVNAEDAVDLKGEVDEYVFTDHTQRYLTTLLEGLLDTAQGHEPDCLRTWISGFFGSGKSHFLKLSAALLSNRVALPDGSQMHALEYAAKRHNVVIPWQRVAQDFKVHAAIVNLAVAVGGTRVAQERPLLHRLRSELCRLAGDSPVPHIAEVEREIRRAKRWPAFEEAVRAETERTGECDDDDEPATWEGWYRKEGGRAHSLLQRVLPKVLPKFSNGAEVEAWLQRMEQESPSPERVIDEAVELARKAHADYGRVLLCVDEVALYLQGNPDRVREVQGLAETLKARGKGRVLLWVTAQQRVDTVDTHFASSDGKVVFLRDRFPERFPLEERDIDEVVRERWLRKDDKSGAYAALKGLLRDHGGLLARACSLHEQSVLHEGDGLTDERAILAYYPCLPYHVRLTQTVLAALRGEKQVDQSAAQSRALLTSIRALFISKNGAGLAEHPVGELVTFDAVYDVIREVVRKADSATDLWITETIDKALGSVGPLRVASVAKVIFLLQRLNPPDERRIKVDAENLAALLYPRIGEPWEPHLQRVRDACILLRERHFVGDDPQRGFRFYRKDERSLQELVDSQSVDPKAVHDALRAATEAVAKKDGLTAYAWSAWHKLDVALTVHAGTPALPNPNSAAKGLELHVVYPPETPPFDVKRQASLYAGAGHICLWVLPASTDAEGIARRALKLKAGIEAYQQQHGSKAADLLRPEYERLTRMQEEELPQAIRAAIQQGVVVYGGVDTPVAGQPKTSGELFADVMKRAVADVFSDLEYGAAQVDDATLRKLRTWAPPQALPKVAKDLKLFDDKGKLLADHAFLKKLQQALQSRPENERTGAVMVQHFGAAPYGWPEKAVRAGLLALLRGRWLTVRLADGAVVRKQDDPRCENWITGSQLFNKGVLELSAAPPPPTDQERLTKLLEVVFDKPGNDTLEKLERRADDLFPDILKRAQAAQADLSGRELPGADRAKSLADLFATVCEIEQPTGRLHVLLQKCRETVKAPKTDVEVFGPAMKVVRATETLRASGGLDPLRDLRRRVRGAYASWQTGNDVVKGHLDDLRVRVDDPSFLDDAEAMKVHDDAVFPAYAADYQARHVERHARVTDALAALEAHPSWETLDEASRAHARSEFTTIDCAAVISLDRTSTPDGRCPSCDTSYETLGDRIEQVEHRLAKQLHQLDDRQPRTGSINLVARNAAPNTRSSEVIVLRSADDVRTFAKRLADLVEETPGVTVTLTIERPEA